MSLIEKKELLSFMTSLSFAFVSSEWFRPKDDPVIFSILCLGLRMLKDNTVPVLEFFTSFKDKLRYLHTLLFIKKMLHICDLIKHYKYNYLL